jgi:hypothetical protein
VAAEVTIGIPVGRCNGECRLRANRFVAFIEMRHWLIFSGEGEARLQSLAPVRRDDASDADSILLRVENQCCARPGPRENFRLGCGPEALRRPGFQSAGDLDAQRIAHRDDFLPRYLRRNFPPRRLMCYKELGPFIEIIRSKSHAAHAEHPINIGSASSSLGTSPKGKWRSALG